MKTDNFYLINYVLTIVINAQSKMTEQQTYDTFTPIWMGTGNGLVSQTLSYT